jgi:hypothetical protein
LSEDIVKWASSQHHHIQYQRFFTSSASFWHFRQNAQRFFERTLKMGTHSNYALRMPMSLKQGFTDFARADGTTLNQFIVSAIAEKLASL